jgi:hypothetical protein
MATSLPVNTDQIPVNTDQVAINAFVLASGSGTTPIATPLWYLYLLG